ncbi:MAG: helix-turn-helix domain-containing protein [Methylocystis sp.]|uniref:helix-turn-helix domain-containing protein n=1 Tax=Methylocystis sp. TaxID=1911079 RepID=UPI003933F31F
MADETPKELRPLAYSVADVERITSSSRTAIYAEMRAGRLLARKIGRRTIIADEDLRRWIASLPLATEAA